MTKGTIVAPNIIQYDEHVFVWLDEIGNAGGVGHSLETAQTGLSSYADHMLWSVSKDDCPWCVSEKQAKRSMGVIEYVKHDKPVVQAMGDEPLVFSSSRAARLQTTLKELYAEMDVNNTTPLLDKFFDDFMCAEFGTDYATSLSPAAVSSARRTFFYAASQVLDYCKTAGAGATARVRAESSAFWNHQLDTMAEYTKLTLVTPT